jgi:hypothetical protein
LTLSVPPRKPQGRALRDAPYALESLASTTRRAERGVMPRGFHRLLAWYMAAWSDETPDKLHNPGVWRDYGEHATGGSALGSPRYSDSFRRYMENTPHETDADGYYSRPIHAALARLGHRKPFMARALFMLAQTGGDWQRVALQLRMVDEVAEVYLGAALAFLWERTHDRTLTG